MANAALVVGWGPAVRGREQKALQVFTLNEADWSRRMTAQQLDDARDRIAGGDATKDEIATITAFVKAERARRADATR